MTLRPILIWVQILFVLLAFSFINTTHAQSVDIDNQSITLSLGTEPPNLDSSLSTDTTSSFILSLTQEGLVRIGKRGEIEPAVAESWTEEGLEVTFKLRKSAVWANGKPVTAHDFVYAWRRLVDPATAAAGATFFAYIIDNAVEIINGKKPPSELAVWAIDERTLKVRLDRPAPYYLFVFTNSGYRPLQQDFVEAQKGRYGADAKHLLSNGPFIIDSWVHSSSLKLEKNPTYWNAKEISFESINFGFITPDNRSLLNLFKSDEIAALRLNEEILTDTLNSGISIKKAPTNCLGWISLNLAEGRFTSNLKVRQAISLVLDRSAYVNTIVGLPGTRLIDSVFTKRMKGTKGSFQTEYPIEPIEFNLEKGKALMEEVKAEMGGESFPPLIILANESRLIEAEFVQSQLINAFGLDVRIDVQTFKQSLVKLRQGEFDIARQGFCGGALRDPVLFAGIFDSASPYNDMDFNNKKYDELMEVTHSTPDANVRMSAFDEMQNILRKEMPIIPILEYSWVYIQDPRLKNMQRFPTQEFSRGYISQ